MPRARRNKDGTAFPALEPFARRLERLRVEGGLSQRALAARANHSVIVLVSVAGALGVSVGDLLESPVPSRDMHLVLVQDLRALAAASSRLIEVVERLVKNDVAPTPRA